MWLRTIDIVDFRNIARARIALVNGLNVLSGANGAGKTNFLEAIGVLSHGKSLRIRTVGDLIRDGSDNGRLSGTFAAERGSAISVQCQLDRTAGKRVVVNGKSVGRISDVFRLVPTVQCFESDTCLLQGPPVARRGFLDCLCAQLECEYLQRHNEFRDALRQRNAALRDGKLTGLLKKALDELFARKAAPIVVTRLRILRRFSETLSNHRLDFTGELELNIESRDLEGTDDVAVTTDLVLQRLARSSSEEHRQHGTSIGPHRDSFSFVIDGGKIRGRSSRGQIKNMMLRIKTCEYHLLQSSLERVPIIVLDDVFAEMDTQRRDNLTRVLQLGAQVFLASTQGTSVFESVRGRASLLIDVVHGSVKVRKDGLVAA